MTEIVLPMHRLRNLLGFICDMDGVLYHGDTLLPGVLEFIDWLKTENKKYMFLTNSSARSPDELCGKLERLGIKVEPDRFYTSALATANFLAHQTPGGSVYVIGEAGIVQALQEAGFVMDDQNPDYVVVADTTSPQNYCYDKIEKAVTLVNKGAKLITTNPDPTFPTSKGVMPCTGALVSPIEITTGIQAYSLGKPNPLIIRFCLNKLGCTHGETAIVGDRMDTDIIAGIEAEMTTVLVLSGETQIEDIRRFSYRPDYVLDDVGMIPRLSKNRKRG